MLIINRVVNSSFDVFVDPDIRTTLTFLGYGADYTAKFRVKRPNTKPYKLTLKNHTPIGLIIGGHQCHIHSPVRLAVKQIRFAVTAPPEVQIERDNCKNKGVRLASAAN